MTAKHKDGDKDGHARRGLLGAMRANFLTGLVVVVPVVLTGYLVWTVAGFIDGWVLPLVPYTYQPSTYIGINIRGYGVLIFLIFTILVGGLTKGLFGRSLIGWGEGMVDRMPVVRSVYNGLKQIVETVLSNSSNSFENACLIEYPRKGLWAVAFIATDTKGEVLQKVPGETEMVSVFLPTTPNPTSGFLLFVPRSDVVLLDMSVEDAAKLIISAGLVNPQVKDGKVVEPPALPGPKAG